MKTIVMSRDHVYVARHNVHIGYVAGQTYERVPEAAVRDILAKGAGAIEAKDRTE